MKTSSLETFYKEVFASVPQGFNKEMGHFNVFRIADVVARLREDKKRPMPYNRRDFYKISLINGNNRAEYADKVIQIDNKAILFATPRIPYHYVPQDDNQQGFFCIFTDEFLTAGKSGLVLDELPIFQPGGYPVFQLTDEVYEELAVIYTKMFRELASDYAFKYDLIRNYLLELIHFGQKLKPISTQQSPAKGTTRVTSLFVELLERQFPITSLYQQLELRTAKDYANRLAIHVNYLNKVLKESMGKTTTEIISSRVIREAKILLKHTDWTISEIAWCLGFEEIAHFSNFFRKHTELSPNTFRA